MYYGPEIYRNEVIDTTLINDNMYYNVYSTLNSSMKYYRVDSLQKLYKYNFSLGDDELIADFQMEVGDSILIGVFGDSIETYLYLTDTNRTIITVTDTFYNCYSFYYDTQEVYDDEMSAYYAPNLGLVLSVMESPVPVFHTLIGAHISGVDVLNVENSIIANEYELLNIYPNPFNNRAVLKINIPVSEQVRIIMYDLSGKEVHIIANNHFKAGIHQFELNGMNLSSGVYFVKAMY